MDIIAPKGGEHVLLQGKEGKSNLASVAGRLLERAVVLLAPIYIRSVIKLIEYPRDRSCTETN